MIYATIYEWPQSQICMECRHRQWLSDILYGSEVICLLAETRNDGVTCPSFCDVDIESPEEDCI